MYLVPEVRVGPDVPVTVDWTLSPRKHLELACPSVSGLYLTDSKLSHGSTH